MSHRLIFVAVSVQLALVPTMVCAQQSDAGRLERRYQAGSATRSEQLRLAESYIEAARYYEASRIASRLLVDDPNDREAAALRERALTGLKDVQDRRVAEAEAAARQKGATDAERLELANVYFESGRYISAAETYERLPAELRTREVRLRHARALAWAGGRTDEAERIYLELLREQPDPEIELEYGRVLSWMGAGEAAIETLTRVYERERSEDAVVALANARAWNDDREGAIALLRTFLESSPDSGEARRLLEEISLSPSLRLERIDRLIELEPYNLALRHQRARLLVDAGRYGEALSTIDFIEDHTRDVPESVRELKATAIARRREGVEKLHARRAELEGRSPNTPEATLELAKAYVALEEYDEGIRLYEAYLRMRPDDTEARVQYARVLGWDRRYDASQRAYRSLLADFPDRADLRLEYAQVLSYDSEFGPAMNQFHRLTDVSSNPRAHLYTDVPSQAHFNRGQIYRWFGWNEHALMEQNSAIDLDATFIPAREELDLVRHLRPASILEGRYTQFEDANDFQMTRLDLEGQKWTSQRTALEASVGRHTFESRGEEVNANALSVGGLYRWRDRWLARGRVGANMYDQDLGTSPFWNIGAEYLPSLQSRVSVDYAHYDLVYDVFTVESLGEGILPSRDPIEIDDLRLHYDLQTSGPLAFLADVTFGSLSDDNERFGAHGLLSFRILKEPYIAVKADYRQLEYDFRSNRYWSPTDYYSLAGILHVGDDVRQRFFWQAELKYGKSYEGDHESDTRAIQGRVIVPITDTLDIIGNYAYGKSGRLESVLGDGGDEFINYWSRRWYVGVRVKRLFRSDDRRGRNPYYFDDRPLEHSPVIPNVGEGH